MLFDSKLPFDTTNAVTGETFGLAWRAVPEPASAMLAAFGGLWVLHGADAASREFRTQKRIPVCHLIMNSEHDF